MSLLLILVGCTCAPQGQPGTWDLEATPTDASTDAVLSDTGSMAGLPFWVDIDMGYLHACGVLDDGRLICWGEDELAELGTDVVDSYQSVSVGTKAGCALASEGSVRCWCLAGDDPICVDASAPGEVDASFGGFVRVEVSTGGACGERRDGTLRCWGFQRGAGADLGEPVLDWDLDSGGGCALLAGNRLSCWASEQDVWSDRPPPDDVVFTRIGVGRNHGCALDEDGRAHCWGYSSFEDEDQSLLPFPDPDPSEVYVDLVSYNEFSCGITSQGDAKCWYAAPPFEDLNGDEDGVIPWGPPPGEQWSTLGLGEWDGCGVTVEGMAHCWDELSDTEGEVGELPSLESLAE